MRKESTKVVSSIARNGPVGRFGLVALLPIPWVSWFAKSRDSILFCFWQLSQARGDHHSISDMLSHHAVAPLSAQ
jgi:hypothetical protein